MHISLSLSLSLSPLSLSLSLSLSLTLSLSHTHTHTHTPGHTCHVIVKSLLVADCDSSFCPGESTRLAVRSQDKRADALWVTTRHKRELLTEQQHVLQLLKTKILGAHKT